jgi:hypothetical protein
MAAPDQVQYIEIGVPARRPCTSSDIAPTARCASSDLATASDHSTFRPTRKPARTSGPPTPSARFETVCALAGFDHGRAATGGALLSGECQRRLAKAEGRGPVHQ